MLNNPTPFHYTFQRVDVSANGQTRTLENLEMANPLGRQVYALGDFKPGPDMQVSFSTINDYGGITPLMSQSIQTSL